MSQSNEIRELCEEIEKLPASEQQIKISELANNIRIEIEFSELDLLARVKGWTLPPTNGMFFSKQSWIFYWHQCKASEKNPELGRPVAPHRSA